MKRENPTPQSRVHSEITLNQQPKYISDRPQNQDQSQRIVSLISQRHNIRPLYARLVAQHHYGVGL